MCPKMRSRFNHHKKSFHGSLKSMTKRNSVRNPCFCFQPKPCSCEKPPIKSVKDTIEKAINDWINSLPVYPSFNIEDKIKLDELAVKLLEGLTKLLEEDDFASKAKEEIINCLKEMPIWQPKDAEDQSVFNNKLAEVLLDSITRNRNIFEEEIKLVGDQVFDEINYDEVYKLVDNFVSSLKNFAERTAMNDKHRETLKNKIIELLNELPVHYNKASEEALNKLAQQFINNLLVLSKHDHENSYKSEIVDEIQKIVLDWLTNISQLSTPDQLDLKIKAFPLIEKLRESLTESLHGTNASEEIQKEMNKWLDKTVQKINSEIENKIKYKLSRELLEKLLQLNDFKNTTKGPSQGDVADKLFQEIMDWLKNIPELEANMKNRFKNVQLLANKLNDIKSREKDLKNLQTRMKVEIFNWLRNMLEINTVKIDPSNQENFANSLLSKVLTLTEKKIMDEYEQYCKTIASWLSDISDLNTGIDTQQVANDLATSLNTIRATADDVIDTTIQAQNKIKDWISHLCDKYGIFVDENDIKKLQDKILLPAEVLPTQRKRWSKLNSVEESVYDEISKLIDNIDTNMNETILNDLKQKTKQLAKKVAEGQMSNDNQVLAELQSALTEATNLLEHEKKHFADAILNTIKSSLPKVLMLKPKEQETMENESEKKERCSINSNGGSKYQAGDIPQEAKISDRNTIASNSETANVRTPIFNGTTSNSKVNDNFKVDKQNEQGTLKNTGKYKDDLLKDPNFTMKPIRKNIVSSTPRNSKDQDKHFGNTNTLSSVYDDNNSDQFEFDFKTYLNQIKKIISDWLDSVKLQISEIDKNNLLKNISADVVERQKYLQLAQKAVSEFEELEYIKFLIFRTLNKTKKNIELGHILSKIEDLYTHLQAIKVPQLIRGITKQNAETMAKLSNDLQSDILKWIQGIPSTILKSKSRLYLEHMIEELLNNMEPTTFFSTNVVDSELSQWLHKILKHNIDQDHFVKLVESLRRLFNNTNDILKTDSIKSKSPEFRSDKEALSSTDDNLYETIKTWCNNLPIYIGASPEDKEKEKSVKQILLRKLMDKVAQINLDPEVLTNDSLYDDIIINEIELLLKSFPFKIYEKESDYKSILIDKLKQAREKIQKQLKTKAYKQMLRSTISRTLPHLEDTLMEQNNLIEDLVDNLVDAFINLQYLTDDDNARYEYKNELYNEVDKFCRDYLMRYPASPLNSTQLNRNLYNALKNVPVPNDESIRSVAEQIRIKDLIIKWFNRLLIDKIALSHLQINQLISLLANRLYNIEKNKELNNTEGSMRTEISEWLQKLSIKFDETFDRLHIINDLIDMLKATETLRKNLSPRTYSNFDIQNDDKTRSKNSREASFHEDPKNDSIKQSAMRHVTSKLSKEDRETLERVRKRSSPNTRIESDSSKKKQKDASVGMPPVETGTQTERSLQTEEQIVQTSRLSLLARPSFIPEITPQVIVKEYYWDTNDSLQSSQIITPKYVAPTTTPQDTHVNSQDKRFSVQSSIAEVPNESEVSKPDTTRNTASYSIPIDSPQPLQRRSKETRPSSVRSKPEILRPYYPEQEEEATRNTSSIESVKDRSNLPMDSQTLYGKRNDNDNQPNPQRSYRKAPPIEMIRSFNNQRPHNSESKERNYRQESNKSNRYLEDDLPLLVLDEDHCRRNKILVVPKDFEIRQETKQLCCRCRDRMLTKCRSRYHESCRQNCNNFWKYCSKCQGEYCPYPSRLYFK